MPLAQTREPLVRVFEALLQEVLGGEQPELALKPRLPTLEVSRRLGSLFGAIIITTRQRKHQAVVTNKVVLFVPFVMGRPGGY